jgi:hypothetical protein
VSGPVIEGSVRDVRQLRGDRWKATVVIGEDEFGMVTTDITCRSDAVRKAARALRRAIQVETASHLALAVENGHKWARAIR